MKPPNKSIKLLLLLITIYQSAPKPNIRKITKNVKISKDLLPGWIDGEGKTSEERSGLNGIPCPSVRMYAVKIRR